MPRYNNLLDLLFQIIKFTKLNQKNERSVLYLRYECHHLTSKVKIKEATAKVDHGKNLQTTQINMGSYLLCLA